MIFGNALDAATCKWRSNLANAGLIKRLQGLLRQARERVVVVLDWTKAHTGLVTQDAHWNQRADRLADKGARESWVPLDAAPAQEPEEEQAREMSQQARTAALDRWLEQQYAALVFFVSGYF